MAEPTTKLYAKTNGNKFVPTLLQKALIFILFAFILPQLPSQAPEFITSRAILNKAFELLYLLLIGIAVSYGLFSRKNADPLPVKKAGSEPDNPNNTYASQVLPNSDHEGEEDGEVQQIWRKQYCPNEPLLVISNENGETIDKPLFLPVRSLNRQKEGSDRDGNHNTSVLPSPIPWNSRSGRIEVKDELPYSKIKSFNSSSSPSPKRLSPSSSFSLSRENSVKKKNLFKEIASLPPIPPPPPPPFHSDRKIKSTVKKCFKDELMDVSMRNRARDFVSNSPNLPRQRKNSIDGSSSFYSMTKDELRDENMRSMRDFVSPERRQRKNSIDGSSSSRPMAKDESKDENIRGMSDFISPEPRQRKNSIDGSLSSRSMAKDESKDESIRRRGDLISSKPRPRSSFDGSVISKSVRTIRPKEVKPEPVNRVSMEPFFLSSSEEDESESSGSEEGETEYDEYSDKEVATMIKEEKKMKEKDDENEVDKKADEFIAKFREQIRLQRIDAIKRSAGQKAVRSHNKKLNS